MKASEWIDEERERYRHEAFRRGNNISHEFAKTEAIVRFLDYLQQSASAWGSDQFFRALERYESPKQKLARLELEKRLKEMQDEIEES